MLEIKNYDLAANKFYSTLDIKSLPINSWDFYASFFDKICQSGNDIFMLKNLAKRNNWLHDENFDEELSQKGHVIVVTDSQLRIVHASQNILDMNGYTSKEVLGKKPKMFQGKDTCEKTLRNIGVAVNKREPFEAVVLNYRKDGSTYKCWIKGNPVFNKSGEIVNFIAYEKEVA